MTEQLELFSSGPFSVRLRFQDAFQIFCEHHWLLTVKGRAYKKAIRRISEYFGKFFLDEVTGTDVEKFCDHLASLPLKQNTINSYRTILILMFNKLKQWKKDGRVGDIDLSKVTIPLDNPAKESKKVDEMQYASKVAWPKKLINRLIATAVVAKDPLLADCLEMLYRTMLRVGDLFAMTPKNVDLARMILSGIQHKTITRKLPSGRPYLYAITPSMAKILKRRIQLVKDDERIFCEDQTMSPTAWRMRIYNRFVRVRKMANAPHVHGTTSSVMTVTE